MFTFASRFVTTSTPVAAPKHAIKAVAEATSTMTTKAAVVTPPEAVERYTICTPREHEVHDAGARTCHAHMTAMQK